MPTIAADRLEALIAAIFAAAGCPGDEAGRIGRYLVDANLAGHDSHGVIRTFRYVDWLQKGLVKAGRHAEVVRENDMLAVVDGGLGFGQTIAPEAVEIGLAKARKGGAALVALRNAGHIGRVGSWAEMAAEAGFVSVHFVNARGSILVAPFGASERRFSTAPFCVGVPRKDEPPLILDFATSVVAEGKVLVASKGGKPLPEGALVDGDGSLSTDPKALYGEAGPDAPPDKRDGKGAIRAFGEHKGSGLALMCELLGGALTGNGTAGPPPRGFANGMLSLYVAPESLGTESFFAEEVREYVEFLKGARPIDADAGILMPGEPERRTAGARRAGGVPLTDDTWSSIMAAARAAGLAETEATRIAGV